MKHTEIADPKQEFWNSVTKVRETERDIDRLDRQMDIELNEIDVRDGQVSRERFASIIGRAVELRLIDSDDLSDMSAQSRDSVKAAFDFVKASAKGIKQVAENPYEFEKQVDKLSMRDASVRRRHFCDLRS